MLNNDRIVRILLENDADIYLHNRYGVSPLFIFSSIYWQQVVKSNYRALAERKTLMLENAKENWKNFFRYNCFDVVLLYDEESNEMADKAESLRVDLSAKNLHVFDPFWLTLKDDSKYLTIQNVFDFNACDVVIIATNDFIDKLGLKNKTKGVKKVICFEDSFIDLDDIQGLFKVFGGTFASSFENLILKLCHDCHWSEDDLDILASILGVNNLMNVKNNPLCVLSWFNYYPLYDAIRSMENNSHKLTLLNEFDEKWKLNY
jgi:hypothetical protein